MSTQRMVAASPLRRQGVDGHPGYDRRCSVLMLPTLLSSLGRAISRLGHYLGIYHH
jgi:hypothetical protein